MFWILRFPFFGPKSNQTWRICMSYDSIFRPNRRRFLKAAASLAGAAVLAGSRRAVTTLAAFAQQPPAARPPPPPQGPPLATLDCENIRTLPPPFPKAGSSRNSVCGNKRRPGLAGGGNLRSSDGTPARVATLYGLTDFASSGGDAFSGGSLESVPHGT